MVHGAAITVKVTLVGMSIQIGLSQKLKRQRAKPTNLKNMVTKFISI